MCAVVEICDRLHSSPLAIASVLVRSNGASPGQATMPLRRGKEISIQNSEVRIQNLGVDLPVAPGAVAADAGPPGGFQVGQEFGEIAFVFGQSDEAADSV